VFTVDSSGNSRLVEIERESIFFRFLLLLLLTEHGRQTSFMWPWLSDNSEIMKKVFWPRCCSVAPLLEHNVAELTYIFAKTLDGVQ
jgi:hypothetical protein